MVRAVLLGKPHLEVAQFQILTDDDVARWSLRLAGGFSEIVHWPMPLSELDFDVMQRAIVEYQHADALCDSWPTVKTNPI